MNRLFNRTAMTALTALFAVAAADLAASTANAQPYNPGYQPGYAAPVVRRDRDRDRDREREREMRRECKSEPIQSIGGSRLSENGAMNSAINLWRRDVIARFGKEFAEYEVAQKAAPRCYHSDILGKLLKQCTITAVPCRVPPDVLPR